MGRLVRDADATNASNGESASPRPSQNRIPTQSRSLIASLLNYWSRNTFDGFAAAARRAGTNAASPAAAASRCPREQERKSVAQYAGFSLHAGIGVEAEQREKFERLTRCVSRRCAPGRCFCCASKSDL